MNTYNIDKMYENYSSEIERMQKCIDELQQENQQLKIQVSSREEVANKYKEVIDEAIKYLKSIEKEPDADMYMMLVEYKEYKYLLQILDKGVDK